VTAEKTPAGEDPDRRRADVEQPRQVAEKRDRRIEPPVVAARLGRLQQAVAQVAMAEPQPVPMSAGSGAGGAVEKRGDAPVPQSGGVRGADDGQRHARWIMR